MCLLGGADAHQVLRVQARFRPPRANVAQVERLARYQRQRQAAAQDLAAPFAEDVIARARVGSDEVTHILNYSEHRYGNSLKHSQGPAYVGDSHILRCGYQHCALYWD